MNWLKDKTVTLVMKFLGGNIIEKALAVLPANGQKTWTALAVTVLLTGIALAGGSTPAWLIGLVQLLQAQNVQPLAEPSALAASASALLSALFAFHKVLKGLKAAYDDARALEAKDENYKEVVEDQSATSELPKAKGY